MSPKLGIAFAIIGGSMTLCGLMAWHLATRDAFDLSNTSTKNGGVQAATMQGVDAGTAGTASTAPDESIPLSVRLADHPAVRYALAVQENDCDTVIGLTLWMAERLQFVQLEGAGEHEVAESRRELCRRLTDRRLENAQFGPSGVEDRYIFMPGADVEVIGVEGGRDDLSRNTEECVVFQVTYPAPERALRDEQGQPIRSLKTRVWVSREGFVLKAGVLGDAEVDPASFQYDWHAST